MKVLDANYLVDYLSGDPVAKAYYDAHDGPDEHWVMPAPAHAEALVGVGNHPTAELDEAVDALSWGEVYTVDEEVSLVAARVADEIGPLPRRRRRTRRCGRPSAGCAGGLGRQRPHPRGNEGGHRRRGIPGVTGVPVGR